MLRAIIVPLAAVTGDTTVITPNTTRLQGTRIIQRKQSWVDARQGCNWAPTGAVGGTIGRNADKGNVDEADGDFSGTYEALERVATTDVWRCAGTRGASPSGGVLSPSRPKTKALPSRGLRAPVGPYRAMPGVVSAGRLDPFKEKFPEFGP